MTITPAHPSGGNLKKKQVSLSRSHGKPYKGTVSFNGRFQVDGLRFAISNLSINNTANTHVGLLGTNKGGISNVGLVGGSVKPPVPDEVITAQPRVAVGFLPHQGSSSGRPEERTQPRTFQTHSAHPQPREKTAPFGRQGYLGARG